MSTSKKRSVLWTHFREVEPKKAKCTHCSSVLSLPKSGNVGNLGRHLSSKHPTVNLIQDRQIPPSISTVVSVNHVQRNKMSTSRKRSVLWTHFSEVEPKKAKCTHCSSVLSLPKCGNVGNLGRHLSSKHPTVNYRQLPPSISTVTESEPEIQAALRGLSNQPSAIQGRNIFENEGEVDPLVISKDNKEVVGKSYTLVHNILTASVDLKVLGDSDVINNEQIISNPEAKTTDAQRANVLTRCVNTDSSLTDTTCTDGTITNSHIERSTVTGGSVTGSSFVESTNTAAQVNRCVCTKSTITVGSVTDSVLIDSTKTAGDITSSTFTNSTMTAGSVSDSTVSGSTCTNCILRRCTVINSTLTNLNYSDATIINNIVKYHS